MEGCGIPGRKLIHLNMSSLQPVIYNSVYFGIDLYANGDTMERAERLTSEKRKRLKRNRTVE